MKKRIKSIDIFRGSSMLWMFLAHLQAWWIRDEDRAYYLLTFAIFDVIGAAGFIFIAGVSTAISYQNRLKKYENKEPPKSKIIRNEYVFRAFFILIIALIYNSMTAIGLQDPLRIWTWFVLLTIAISLFLCWPLLKLRKEIRILIGFGIWILHRILVSFLEPYEDVYSYYGILYFILYHTPDLNPILAFFPFLVFGTVVGETIHEIYSIEDLNMRKQWIKKRLIAPLLFFGGILIMFGIVYDFPEFFQHRTFPWLFYSLGIQLCFLAMLFLGEEFLFSHIEKSYKFLFYFSYYSLTVFLSHYLLFFLFSRELSLIRIWATILIVTILVGLVLRIIYKLLGSKASLKNHIGRWSLELAQIIENQKRD
ncbi:MAG: DUF1624 domain-containing protein [Candidatus Lokiarchaeota archaeon]|nr:DUF1624 domain-containing protein [Candidatus Lokiarchaeota archaeon]MBD3341812.1 DUF1624 domain-containing protein [Candidatus Lokiarchaeota archaeon]